MREEILAVTEFSRGLPVKVILETSLLEKKEIIKLCELTIECNAQFVKTSTGFGKSGATLEDVRLMREVVGPDFGVKASGGIRDLETALAMIKAGATRLGTSSGAKIVAEFKSTGASL